MTRPELFSVELDVVDIRFYSYPPTDFGAGGHLLSSRVPRPIRLAERLFR